MYYTKRKCLTPPQLHNARTTFFVIVRQIAVGISDEVDDAFGYAGSDVVVIDTPHVGVDAREAVVLAVV